MLHTRHAPRCAALPSVVALNVDVCTNGSEMPIEGLGAPIVSHRGWLQIQHRPNMTDDLSRHVLQCGKVMQLLKRLEQHDQTQTARIAAGEARSPFHFVHIGGVMPEQVACRYHKRKPRVRSTSLNSRN